jgi:hypothetical protein
MERARKVMNTNVGIYRSSGKDARIKERETERQPPRKYSELSRLYKQLLKKHELLV